MDLLAFIVFCSAVAYNEAIKCHDCTSWNPYCREEVNEPFPDAVATVECDKTNTCFLKKEANGVISRGCTDWWMESQVDIDYVGCKSQTLPWLGKQTWCFCKNDYCNGGSIAMMDAGVTPEKVRQNLVQDQLGWDNSFEWQQWQDNTNSWQQPDSDDVQGNTIHEHQVFDDVSPHANTKDADDRNSDPVYKVWWWHADSDRPRFSNADRSWKAPRWVQKKDGLGWDFPITTRDQVQPQTFVKTTEQWGWGRGWGHIMPWWSGRFTHVHRLRPTEESTWKRTTTTEATTTTTTAAPSTVKAVVQNEGENSIVEVREKGDFDMTNNIIDSQIEVAEFFCWDCYSDSPHCGERVNTIKAHYLGKTQCSSTNKCFVRRQGDVIYRGCADGWQSSATNIDYEGCRVQYLFGKPVEWCFCTASLCNGDSMEDIKNINMQHIHPHPYKNNNTSSNSSIMTTVTTTSSTNTVKHNPFTKRASTRTTTSSTTNEKKTETPTAKTTTSSTTTLSDTHTTRTSSTATRGARHSKSDRHDYINANREFVKRSTTPENTFAARKNPSVTKMFDALVHK